jgi:ATP-binding cassette subfamily B multidrug efflux pump
LKSESLFKRHVLDHKMKYVLGAALLSISCLFQLVIPRILKEFTDGLEMMAITMEDILFYALWIVLIGLATAIFRSSGRIYLFRLSRVLEKGIRSRLFTHWEKQSAEYFNKQRIGDLMSHAINDVNIIREVGMMGVFMTIEAIVLISVTVVMMGYTVNLGLTLLVMLPLPGLTYMAYKFRAQIHIRATRVQEAIGQIASRVQQFASGIRVIKTYVQEKEEMKKFTQDNENNVQANRHLIRSNSLFTSVSQGIVGLSYLISVVFGGILVMKNTITLGDFVAFNTYLALLVVPVENLGKVINTLQRGKAADFRLRHILATLPEVREALPFSMQSFYIIVGNSYF